MENYFVYIITNTNKTVLYTGITNDLAKRLCEHKNAGCEPNSFTGRYGVYRLLYYECYTDVTEAIAREKEIKKWRREKKIRLIESLNPYWKFLEEEGGIW